uniref:Meiosis-specific, MEI4 homolog (S. cerevisiae) n=1 Tax=Oncorhynchus kisutch TaxID=8019 RepID=A0A8C7N5H3_ONCKI
NIGQTVSYTAEWGLRKAKLVVAVAIIKSKPPGISGRKHAEHLANKLNSQTEAWKTKAQRLQEEVLRMRQKLLLTQMLSKPKNTSGTEAGETLLPTQDSAEPSAQPAFPPVTTTPPQIPFSSLCEADPRGKAMLLHMQFLQSLCGLKRVEWEDRSVVADSVCQLLSCVVSASRDDRPLPPRSLLLQASRVAAQAVDHWLSHRQPSQLFVTGMEDSLKELTDVLLRNGQLNRVREHDAYRSVIMTIYFTVLYLCSQVVYFNFLCDVCVFQGESSEGPGQFDISLYENSFYLFWLLEQLLQQRALLGRLEHSVLLLSDDFPLYSLYMWRIGALLAPSNINNTQT